MERVINVPCLFSAVLVFLALLVGWGGSEASIISVTKNDSGGDVTVPMNGVFTIELKQTAGTGYVWAFDELDREHFEILTEETKPNAEPGRVGGPAIKVWVLRAKKIGTSLIRMLYFRPWEGKEKAEEAFELRVHIER